MQCSLRTAPRTSLQAKTTRKRQCFTCSRIIQLLVRQLFGSCEKSAYHAGRGVYAYFTALDIGQGRFEEEVETVSGFLEIMKPNDMLLFNEVYQSTAFDEASVALSEFIAVACLYGSRVIAVTHLPDMKKNLTDLQDKLRFEGNQVRQSRKKNGEDSQVHPYRIKSKSMEQSRFLSGTHYTAKSAAPKNLL